MDPRNNFYNKNHLEYARELRSRMATRGERYIWKVLLSKRQTGYRFLRQRPIDYYIVDFFCPELKLIIEIDGISHLNKGEYDYKRQKKLEKLGFRIIRFQEGDVLQNIDKIDNEIRNIIYSIRAENDIEN